MHQDRPKNASRGQSEQSAEDKEPLPPALIRELKRRLRDSRDPVRYMLVSEFSRRFILYYNVSSDTYIMNQPTGGTLFKRVKAAESVKQLLGAGVAIVKFTTKGGKLKRLSPYSGRWMRESKKHRRPRGKMRQ
jgi:hypothetical protein